MDLEAATILTEHTDTGTATLEDGEFPGAGRARLGQRTRDPPQPVDPRRPRRRRPRGRAAAITIEYPGGSGNFRYLHALLNEEGELHDADTVFLGDRIRVAGLSIHEGIITVAVIERPPDAPFSEVPSILVIRRFPPRGRGTGGDRGHQRR